jgi:hypothetical protein
VRVLVVNAGSRSLKLRVSVLVTSSTPFRQGAAGVADATSQCR